MGPWKKVIIQAITPLIASGLIISGLNYFYNDFYNKPLINIQIIPTGQSKHPTVVVMNEGRIPATNFFLTLITPHHMVDYPHYPQTFSTLNATKIVWINSTLLQVAIPKFPQGDGSLTKISLRYNDSDSTAVYPKYTAYITYDQGSSKISIGKTLTFIEIVSDFWNTYWISIVLIASGLFILLIILSARIILRGFTGGRDTTLYPLFFPSLYPLLVRLIPDIFHVTHDTKYKRAEEVLNDIIVIQKQLKGTWDRIHWVSFQSYRDKWNKTKEVAKRQIFKYDMKVYNLIGDLYSKLNDRELYYLSNISYAWSGYGMDEHYKIIDDFDNKIREKCNEILNNSTVDWKSLTSTEQHSD